MRNVGLLSPTPHRIGSYGPFMLDGEFAFSDFEHWGRGHNRGFQSCIEACRGKRCVFDVGAHIGLVALPMSRVVADGGTVYAFEPAAANLTHLHGHLQLNGITNITVVETLVGRDEKPAVPFFESPLASGQNSAVRKHRPDRYIEAQRPQTTLDAFCRVNGLAPEIIKIDVEGSEIAVLEGARELLARHAPTIFLSVHPAELAALGQSDTELAKLIDDLGYQCRDIDDNIQQTFHFDEYVLTPKLRQ